MNEIEATEELDRMNLVVVGIVEKLSPIEGKDFVELVSIKDIGYTFVCEKIHKIGDKIVWIKYDTIVPNNELFSFMSESKFRVKAKAFTHRDEDDNVVGKTYSQGIVLPFNKVINFTAKRDCNDSIIDKEFQSQLWQEGDDLTTFLEVKKYIPPTVGGNSLGIIQSKGDFPTHLLSKTDETNLSSRIKSLFELEGKSVFFTTKSEGSSLTVYIDPEEKELNVCSRNNILKEVEGSKFWQAVNKYNLKETLQQYPNIALQAEICGPKIQNNHFGLQELELHVFNCIDIADNRRRLNYDETVEIVKNLNMKMVTVVYKTDNFKFVDGDFPNDIFNPLTDVNEDTVWTFDRLQRFTDAQKYPNGNIAEGIVIRPCEPFVSSNLRTIWSGKIIGRDYKL